VRQARDGSQYGGTQSTDISRINRRHYWPHLGVDPGVFTQKNKEKSAEMSTPFVELSGYLTIEVISTSGFSLGPQFHQPAVGCKPC
jgi:hypothetical protein